MWAEGYRSLKKENAQIRAELELERIGRQEDRRHHEIDMADRDRQIEWLKEQMPRWFERPQFLVPVVVAVTVWATLQIVQVSLE